MAADMMITTAPAPPDSFAVRAEISREMVRIYKDQLGRGPTKVRSDFMGHDVLLVTLEHTLTPAEKTLAGLGELARVREVRQILHYAAEDEFRSCVELVTGRTVRGFVSGVDISEDIASELFYLDPVAET
jgi:uncharacterized protein YbcI